MTGSSSLPPGGAATPRQVAAPDWGSPDFIMAAAAPLVVELGTGNQPSLPAAPGLGSADRGMSAIPTQTPVNIMDPWSLPQEAGLIQAVLAPLLGSSADLAKPMDAASRQTQLQTPNQPFEMPLGLDAALNGGAPLHDPALDRVMANWRSADGGGAPLHGGGAAPSQIPSAQGVSLDRPPPATSSLAQSGGSLSPIEVQSIRADFPILNQTVNGHPLAWLDNAATTQKPRAVMAAITEFYERDNSNIHRAAHTLAARATDAYELARVKVQRFLKAKSASEIVFVRGTTEAINLVAQSFGRANLQAGDEVIVATLEHHANIVPWQMVCQEKGAVLRAIPITDIGEVDLQAYMRMLSPRVRIVALAHVSNVLGTVLPVREMTAMAHAVGARVLIDGAQAVAHEPVNVCEIGCDFYVFSGHKIYGPTGVGALYARQELLESMPPWQGGGNMIDEVTFAKTSYAPPPAKFEAGTATLADAVGLGAALDYLTRVGVERAALHEQSLLHAATAELSAIPGLRIYGSAPHKAAVVSFLMDGVAAEEVGKQLDKVGIAVRTGHHCAQPTMQRFGVRGMVRPSFALYNTLEEVDRLVRAVWSIRSSQR